MQVSLKCDTKNGYFTLKDMHIYDSIWLNSSKNDVSDTVCGESQNTHFMFNNFFFRRSCRFLEYVYKHRTPTQPTDDNIIRRTRVPCWITKTTNKHTHTQTDLECVILITVNSSTCSVALQPSKGNPLLRFHSNNGYSNSPQRNVRALFVLLKCCTSFKQARA